MQIILSVSIAVLAGLLMTRVVKSLKLPDVTAYLIAGIFVGAYFLGSLGIDGLGFISMEAVDLMTLVSQVALGFIAFAIGNEFRLEEITHIGRQAVVVGVFQGLAAMLCVDTALLLLHILIPDKLSVAQAITLGAISTATAPAATLMVVICCCLLSRWTMRSALWPSPFPLGSRARYPAEWSTSYPFW